MGMVTYWWHSGGRWELRFHFFSILHQKLSCIFWGNRSPQSCKRLLPLFASLLCFLIHLLLLLSREGMVGLVASTLSPAMFLALLDQPTRVRLPAVVARCCFLWSWWGRFWAFSVHHTITYALAKINAHSVEKVAWFSAPWSAEKAKYRKKNDFTHKTQ